MCNCNTCLWRQPNCSSAIFAPPQIPPLLITLHEQQVPSAHLRLSRRFDPRSISFNFSTDDEDVRCRERHQVLPGERHVVEGRLQRMQGHHGRLSRRYDKRQDLRGGIHDQPGHADGGCGDLHLFQVSFGRKTSFVQILKRPRSFQGAQVSAQHHPHKPDVRVHAHVRGVAADVAHPPPDQLPRSGGRGEEHPHHLHPADRPPALLPPGHLLLDGGRR